MIMILHTCKLKLNNMITQLKQNLGKPDNKKWKLIADYLLYVALPAINVFFITVQPISPEFSLWGNGVSTLVISLFKGLTKFTTNATESNT